MTIAVESIYPLVDLSTDAFRQAYHHGLWWCMYGECTHNGPLDDCYLVDNLKTVAMRGYFDGEHESSLLPSIGFYIGMIHGGILSPETGELLQGSTTLVTFTNKWTRKGYRAGREWFFNEVEPEKRRFTDTSFIKRLRESINDMLSFRHRASTWSYSIGCVLGELSGQLFPQTAQEYHHWEKVRLRLEARIKSWEGKRERNTEALPILDAMQEA